MAKKIALKTGKNSNKVSDYIGAIDSEAMRKDAKNLLKVFKEVTGAQPRMWGTSIVGYGEYTYFRSNGDEGEYMATGFSMRKSGPTIYIMPGYQDFGPELKQLGPHKLGKSCLYLKQLDDIDLTVLKRMIRDGLRSLKKTHTVRMT